MCGCRSRESCGQSGQLRAGEGAGLHGRENGRPRFVVLGTGKRLFAAVSDKRRLQLKDTNVFGDGVMLLVYARAAAGA
jgi:hypothetical protein